MTEKETLAHLTAELAKAERSLESRTIEGVSDALSTLIGLARWTITEAAGR